LEQFEDKHSLQMTLARTRPFRQSWDGFFVW
jgi:hypothetical protein